MCTFTLKTTTKPNHHKYLITRDYKNINWEEFKTSLSEDQRLVTAATSDDPDIISISIQQAVTHHLDIAAPTKKIQVK